MAAGIPARLTPKEGRRFGLTVGAAFLALAALAAWRGSSRGLAIFGALGGILVLSGLAVPSRLGPVYRRWMALAVLLSKVTTPILMGIVYFLVITPIGLLLRLAGRRPLPKPRSAGSLWVRREPGNRQSDLLRQF